MLGGMPVADDQCCRAGAGHDGLVVSGRHDRVSVFRSQGLGVVAGRRADHALLAVGLAERGDGVVGAAELERPGSLHGSAKATLDTYGHLWPDKDESTTAVIDAVVDSKFRDLADPVRTEGGAP